MILSKAAFAITSPSESEFINFFILVRIFPLTSLNSSLSGWEGSAFGRNLDKFSFRLGEEVSKEISFF